jgi:hypothetical protein
MTEESKEHQTLTTINCGDTTCKGCKHMRYFGDALFCMSDPSKPVFLKPVEGQRDASWRDLFFYRSKECLEAEAKAKETISKSDLKNLLLWMSEHEFPVYSWDEHGHCDDAYCDAINAVETKLKQLLGQHDTTRL